jgi:monoamine oxidase
MVSGYEPIVNGIAKDLEQNPKISFLLNHRVEKVDHNSELVNVVTKYEGNTIEMEANMVIITVSLGVLKSESIVFQPSLPADKRDAIRRFGFGLLDKIFLIFNETFWEKECSWISHAAKNRSEFPAYLNLQHYTKRDISILCAFYSGKFAAEIEKLSENEAIELALRPLITYFGEETVRRNFKYGIRTCWQKDPLFFGSYSYVAYGMQPDDLEHLRKPLHNKVFFAGIFISEQLY